MSIQPPAPNPCGSCPYRQDVPSGVWDREEYDKLPEYDQETATQPVGVFLCHQQNGSICAGWCGVHDMNEALSIRLAVSMGKITPEDADTILDYTTPVPLFGTGQEAAEHGLAALDRPDADARKVIDKLTRKQKAR